MTQKNALSREAEGAQDGTSRQPYDNPSPGDETSTSAPEQVNLLSKWHLAMHSTHDPRLTSCDRQVLLQILNLYSVERGCAYPSMQYLANNTGRSRQGVGKSIGNLVKHGYIVIQRHGRLHVNNEYAPVWREYVTPNSKDASCANTGFHNGANNGFTACANNRTKDGNHGLHHPSHEAGHKPAECERETGAGAPSAGASPTPPAAAARAGDNSQQPVVSLQYSDFWAVYPKKRRVVAAEKAIKRALDAGADYQAIVAGAAAYGAWVKAQHWYGEDRYISQPDNFIRDSKWLEDFTITERKPKATKTTSTGGKKKRARSNGTKPDHYPDHWSDLNSAQRKHFANGDFIDKNGKRRRFTNPVFKQCQDRQKTVWQYREMLQRHMPSCDTCRGVESKEQLCSRGSKLVEQYWKHEQDFEAWAKEQPKAVKWLDLETGEPYQP